MVEAEVEIMTVEIVKGKPYSCPLLKADKEKFEYSFDTSKADHIFEYLQKDKQIWLMYGHKILCAEELKEKQYCKWHNSYSHNTSNDIAMSSEGRKLQIGKIRVLVKGLSVLTHFLVLM